MKRFLCLLLAVTMLLAVHITGVYAVEAVTASDDAIRILKLEEGFSKTPYWDYAQWTVGYGTKCPDDKLEEYRANGISEEEAEALLRTYIAKFEAELYAFMVRTGVQLSQNQFDALLLFSYNCGSAWTYSPGGGLYNAVVNGATGSELIDAFSRWCNAGGQIKTFLLRRRLCEANIYLNGEYSQTAPQNFGYVLYDACGGTAKPNVQGFHTDLTAQIIPAPVYEGHTFDGWYTEKTGGEKVEILDASVRNARLYAHWTDANGNSTAQPEETGVNVTVTANGVNVRSGPGTNHGVVGSANTGDLLVITETAEGSGYTWGKFRGGWICLTYTNYDIVCPEEPDEPQTSQVKMGTVRVNDLLRVRSGPSTGYEVVAHLDNGARVEILEEKLIGTMRWGRIVSGWISLDYVTMDPVQLPEQEQTQPPATEPTQPPATEETVPPTQKPAQPEESQPPSESREETTGKWTGTVKVSDLLRVRSGPSTTNPVVGYLKDGQRVTVTEKTTAGSMTWGKVEQGWISLDYVQLDPDKEAPQQSVKGVVKVSDLLRVRSGPGTSYAIAAYLKNGTAVEILEQKTVNGSLWGRTEAGWISLDYVQLAQRPSQTPAKTVTVTADCLRVRKEPGTASSIVGYLYAGAKVEILEQKTVNGSAWGRTAKGWISLDYVK